MESLQIVDIIKQLPLNEKLLIIELIFRDIRKDSLIKKTDEHRRNEAANLLLADYQNDEELTAFSILDKDYFYETN